MILAIKTADLTSQLYLLSADGKVEHELSWDSGRGLSDQLLDKTQQFLTDAGTSPKDLAGIIIFSGPGSFTSLRIGHTVANALADSLGIPVVGAAGERWQTDGARQIKTTEPGRPALPHYGSDAHITRPKS